HWSALLKPEVGRWTAQLPSPASRLPPRTAGPAAPPQASAHMLLTRRTPTLPDHSTMQVLAISRRWPVAPAPRYQRAGSNRLRTASATRDAPPRPGTGPGFRADRQEGSDTERSR